MDAKRLLDLSGSMHKKHSEMLTLWQEIAMEVWPEMADFTETRNIGSEYADHLMSGHPARCRRELGDSFESMLFQGDWFSMKTTDPELDLDNDAREWLEKNTKRMMRVMTDRKAKFMRARKLVNHGYAACGQWPLSIEMVQTADGPQLLYRAWHLRDVAFQEGITGDIEIYSHKLEINAGDVLKMFGDKCSDQIKKAAQDRPFEKIKLIRMVLPSAMCDGKFPQPYVSYYIDPQSNDKQILECVGQWTPVYRMPRWASVGSVSQYAFSPAAMMSMPDCRMFQQMSLSMIDAAEKGANPPLVARNGLFREDFPQSAGMIGYADIESNEDIRQALMPLTNDKSGYSFALEIVRDTKYEIAKHWYNDLLSPPDTSRAKTAYEASVIVNNHIRSLLPVFQPVAPEYQAPICEDTFELLMRKGFFGHPSTFPEKLQGADVEFAFVSPLSQAEDGKKVAEFHSMLELLSLGASADPSIKHIANIPVAMRDAMQGAEVQAKWLRTDEEVSEMADQDAKALQAQQMMAQVQQGADIAKTLSEANASGGLM